MPWFGIVSFEDPLFCNAKRDVTRSKVFLKKIICKINKEIGRDVRHVRDLHIFTSQLIYECNISFICMRFEKDPDRFLEMDGNRKTV
jgi:hypothetical protein